MWERSKEEKSKRKSGGKGGEGEKVGVDRKRSKKEVKTREGEGL